MTNEVLVDESMPDGGVATGQLVLIVDDVFDALTTERSYKAALSPDQALETLAEEVERGWWDKRIFEEFRDMASDGLGSIDYAPSLAR